MRFLFLLAIIHNCDTFCEAQWLSNISNMSDNNEIISEPVNAISSLTYTGFGIVGVFMKNHSSTYYLLMNLFILAGLSSFFHHYYLSINNTKWTYASDVISMYLLSSFSLFYILNDHEYNKFRKCSKFIGFLNTITCVCMLVFYKTNIGRRNLLMQIQVAVIILTQCFICIYFFNINSSIKFKIFYSSLWNGILFSLGASMWYFDNVCLDWSINHRFNAHAIWHVTVSWALFNAINITNICRYTFNEVKFTWQPLFTQFPGVLYIIQIGIEKTNIRNNYTSINLEEVKLIDGPKSHRRTNTYG